MVGGAAKAPATTSCSRQLEERKGRGKVCCPISFKDRFRVYPHHFHLYLINQSSVTCSRLALSEAKKSKLVGQQWAQLKVGILFVKTEGLLGIGRQQRPLSLYFNGSCSQVTAVSKQGRKWVEKIEAGSLPIHILAGGVGWSKKSFFFFSPYRKGPLIYRPLHFIS